MGWKRIEKREMLYETFQKRTSSLPQPNRIKIIQLLINIPYNMNTNV